MGRSLGLTQGGGWGQASSATDSSPGSCPLAVSPGLGAGEVTRHSLQAWQTPRPGRWEWAPWRGHCLFPTASGFHPAPHAAPPGHGFPNNTLVKQPFRAHQSQTLSTEVLRRHGLRFQRSHVQPWRNPSCCRWGSAVAGHLLCPSLCEHGLLLPPPPSSFHRVRNHGLNLGI